MHDITFPAHFSEHHGTKPKKVQPHTVAVTVRCHWYGFIRWETSLRASLKKKKKFLVDMSIMIRRKKAQDAISEKTQEVCRFGSIWPFSDHFGHLRLFLAIPKCPSKTHV